MRWDEKTQVFGRAVGIICVVTVLLLAGPACAVLEEELPRAQTRMSRRECISAALENNLDIKISRIEPLSAAARITGAWGPYDPALTGGISMAERKYPGGLIDIQGVTIRAPSSKVAFVRGNLGLQGLIPTGTSYNLAYSSRRHKSYGGSVFGGGGGEPAEYTGDISLELTQSLLRGLGLDVNLAQIHIAAINKEISEFELMRTVMQTVADVQSAYWELVFARENLEVRKKSLAVARDLLDRNRRRLAIGTAARFEVDQAEAGVAVREADIIAARAAVRDAEDRLKQVMNMRDDEAYWTAEIVVTDTAEMVDRAISLDDEIRLAHAERPEILQARKNIEAAETNLRVARNRVLPQVDVFGSYGFSSRQLSYPKELEYLVRADDYAYAYGVTASVPIGNRTARAERIAAEHALKQAKLQLERFKHNIAVEIRQAVRNVTTNMRLVDANRATRELREKTLDDEQTRYEVGVSTSYQVLEVEEQLAEARSGELRAIIDYRKALVALDLADGTILPKNNIAFVAEEL